MSTLIKVEVSYGQLAIFSASMKQPFNDWTDRHVAQGFAWREGSVSFRSLAESGYHLVEIDLVDHVGPILPNAVRVIEVPFFVPDDRAIEIGSITDTVSLDFPSGSYLLRCEFLQYNETSGKQVRLTFSNKDEPHFSIIRADSEISIDGELITTAVAAIS